MEGVWHLIAASLAFVVSICGWRVVKWGYMRPKRLEKLVRKQGFMGIPIEWCMGT
ncbi:UNVERIFIED_CONTAM: hypothetical protein Sradi_6093900 [Sesamum radiatum]|uniref:Uncharacterized protein n=1 Tax=Sesamum radiatum TaxID=300843 RepID=A0AAW2KIY2_SESRA